MNANDSTAVFGLIGLGTMGSNLALNIEDHGFSLAVWNLEPERVEAFLQANPGRQVRAAATFAELAAALTRPRRILLMIPAGKPVDQTIEKLIPVLEPGDIVIDGGNSHFAETKRRGAMLAEHGLEFIGLGVSGGSAGARYGPSLMPGGPRPAYEAIRDVLEAIAARTASGPCVGYLGPDGAGHFIKMVHNGIEYADMQGIAEAYDVLRRGGGLDGLELADVFAEWNAGPLESYLTEITAAVLRWMDPSTDTPLVEQIVDEAEQKGTGRWTVITALELGVPVPSIAAAVDARGVSSRRALRKTLSQTVRGPGGDATSAIGGDAASVWSREEWIQAARDALDASRVCAFAQGMDLISAGSAENGWAIPRAEVARLWTGGCIIRARLLDDLRAAYECQPDLPNLLMDETLGDRVERSQAGWRRAIAAATARGIPTPCWSAALAWFDMARTARLPQNLIQAQRDYFGAHTYRRLDGAAGTPAIHTDWANPGGGTGAR
ncbi:MAG: NADP-dependent phosphogluconate dehydrogenase [Gemmatimonadota bacterium]